MLELSVDSGGRLVSNALRGRERVFVRDDGAGWLREAFRSKCSVCLFPVASVARRRVEIDLLMLFRKSPQFVCAALLLCAFAGCLSSDVPPIDGRLEIENVAKWRQLYCADNGGKPPADEAAFLAFIQKKLAERGDTSPADDMLISPRDGKKYVIMYGKDSAKLSEFSVAVHEQEGYGGKVLIALESARSREVDASELPSLLAAPQ